MNDDTINYSSVFCFFFLNGEKPRSDLENKI